MIRINLLPVRAAKKKEAVQRHLVLFIAGLVTVFVVCFAMYQTKASQLNEIEETNKMLVDEIENLKKIIGEVDEYKEQEALLERKLGVIRTLKANKTGPVHMLDELASNIPEKLWLTNLDEVEGRVTLEGVSINNEVIATFMSRLEESSYFTEVYLVSIERENMEDLNLKRFTITSRLVVPGADVPLEG
jgi:type IV pilus assembly protein PilN